MSIKASPDYLNGTKSATQIAIQSNMGKCGNDIVQERAKRFSKYWSSAFDVKKTNNLCIK